MEEDIKHRRLHAFHYSKVLNALMLVAIVALLQIGYVKSLLMPVVCMSVAVALFAGYSLWLWIKKPAEIIIDRRLSTISSIYTVYFIIVASIGDFNAWWYIIPSVVAIIVMFICLIRPSDEVFEIKI